MLHLNQMRTSNAFKSFYSNASNARIAVDRMFTHPDQGFAYPDQDIHTALALLHPVRPASCGLIRKLTCHLLFANVDPSIAKAGK